MQYFTAEKQVEKFLEDVEEMYADAPVNAPPMNEHTRFSEESLSFTPLVADEGDALLVNLGDRKCNLHNFFYTFYNRIILQLTNGHSGRMMSFHRPKKTRTSSSRTNRVTGLVDLPQ